MTNQPYIAPLPSVRAQVITRRTYNRPLDDGTFETWTDTVNRVIQHQAWLWQRAKGSSLSRKEGDELLELRRLLLDRRISMSGRTLWLGGTDVAKTREASQFNCSFGQINTVSDVVDAFWLLLQGCGVGFEPITGTLSGFAKPVEVEVRRSLNRTTKGTEENHESFWGTDSKEWYIQVGDSAEAWAKSVGKLLANKRPMDKLVLDFSLIRAPGIRLKGYGWISSGDETISTAFVKIAEILNGASGRLLTKIEILDILNHLGTTLSSRRSAEIALMPLDDPEAEAFIKAKRDFWLSGNNQRSQSNNSVVFHKKPSKLELRGLFATMLDAGGSEPGFYNAEAALKRAPWFKGTNPCGEILLGNKSFCNLVEVAVSKFNGRANELRRAIWIAARANYRQTCVNLEDGVLQRVWHEQNEQLRLTGVGLTGIVQWSDMNAISLMRLRDSAKEGVDSMADELGLPRSKAVTTIKPSGTLSKIMDVTEGAHMPLGKYIFNNVRFAHTDPLVPKLVAAGYRTFQDPFNPDAILATLPVKWEGVKGFEEVNGTPVCRESAVAQLERYKLLMDNYVDHNCSITVSYSPEEAEGIVDWLYENWDSYVGVSFLLRADPTKTAEDLGYPYLPQEVVSKEVYEAYTSGLSELDLDSARINDDSDLEDDCAIGACPIR